MEAFFVSTVLVTLAEMGDKTQLLSLVLAARYRKPVPIILGIFVATVVNHAGAGALGNWLTSLVSADTLRWLLGLSFIAMAGWMLIPDKLDDEESASLGKMGVFAATVIAFFLAEMGDKTQIATVALAARFDSLLAVVMGTTVGMMLANVPVVIAGDKLTKRLPIRLIHGIAAVVFVLLGILVLLQSPV